MPQGEPVPGAVEAVSPSYDEGPQGPAAVRDPARSLSGCDRILILGRTGSGKTTLARALASSIGVPHVELDALHFGPGFSTVPLPLLRERVAGAIGADRWVTDGNKKAVRDLTWARADTVVWLDYPLVVSFWRLGKRALWRTSTLRKRSAPAQADGSGSLTGSDGGTGVADGRGRSDGEALPLQLLSAAKGVLTALRSHRGQRRRYPRMFAAPENRHLAVVRLRSPRATRRWLAAVTAG